MHVILKKLRIAIVAIVDDVRTFKRLIEIPNIVQVMKRLEG